MELEEVLSETECRNGLDMTIELLLLELSDYNFGHLLICGYLLSLFGVVA